MMKLIILVLLVSVALNKMIWLADVSNTGARYPINDIYDGNASLAMKGQLNSIGMRQQYLLGTYLRADYIDQERLIDPIYNPNTVQVFACTDIDNTYDSAISKLYGLFPIGTGWRIPETVSKQRLEPPFQSDFKYQGFRKNTGNDLPFALNLGFQPVPVWPLDNILNNPCPNAGSLQTKRLSQIGKNLTLFQIQHSALIAKAKLVFNLTLVNLNIPVMANLYDTLISDLTLGKILPKDWNDYDMKSLKFISNYYDTLLNDGSYAEIFSTLMLSSLKQKMQRVLNRTIGQKKWSIYFPKQGALTPIMTILNLTSAQCLQQKWKNQTITALNCMEPPTFSSNLLFELHQDDSFEYRIKMRYNGQYAAMCQQQKFECEYHNFWNRVKISVENYKQACNSK